MAVTAGNLKPWSVSAKDYPTQGSAQERLFFLLRYAVLAPSLYNSQPWRFHIYADRIEISADESRRLPHIDGDDRGLLISLGCALENLLIAAEHFEYGWQLSLSNNGDNPAALLRLLPGCPMEHGRDPALFDVITTRRSGSQVFGEDVIDNNDVDWLREFCLESALDVYAVRNPEKRTALAELCAQAHAIQQANDQCRSQISAWQRAVTGRGRLAEWLAQLLSPFGHGADEPSAAVLDAPALIVISALDRSTSNCLQCGQAFQRMGLAAANLGMMFYPVDVLLQVESLQPALKDLLADSRETLMIFCVGRARESARRTTRIDPQLVASIRN